MEVGEGGANEDGTKLEMRRVGICREAIEMARSRFRLGITWARRNLFNKQFLNSRKEIRKKKNPP